MPTTILPVHGSVTPYSKKYTLAGDGNPGLRSFTQILSDLDEGPLKQALRTMGAAHLANFQLNGIYGNAIRIYDVPATLADAAALRSGPRNIFWFSNADPDVAGLSCTVAFGNILTIEIRLNHTTQA